MRDMPADVSTPEGAGPAASVLAAHGQTRRLGSMRRGARGLIVGIVPPAARKADAIDGAELERRLLEMGFVEGAMVEVLHEGPIGRDPIAVKIDETRVALRRRDADALIVSAERDRHAA